MLRETDQDCDFPSLGSGRFNALPHEDGLLDAAQRLLVSTAALIAYAELPLVTIAWDRRVVPSVIRILPWRSGPAIDAEIRPEDVPPELRSALENMASHGLELCLMLARRWPANAVPPVIGVVSDGIGLALSQDHPSATDAQWLSDHLHGHSPAAEILPFAADAALFRLIEPQAGQRRH